MNDTVSIIIPIYQSEKTIKKCLESVINQTYRDIEILVIDDGSTDNSYKICEEYSKLDDRVKVIHKENSGVSSTRNLGIKEANSKWILFVDSDDYIERNMIERMLNKANINQSQIVICGYNKLVNQKLEKRVCINGDIIVDSIKEIESQFGNLCLKNLINTPWNKLYTKEYITTNFEENLSLGEDLIFNLNYLRNINKITIIKDCLYNYNAESDEKSLSMQYREDRFEIMEKLYIELRDFSIDIFGQDYNLDRVYRIFINNIFRVLISAEKNKKLNLKSKTIFSKILHNDNVKYTVKQIIKLPITLRIFQILLKIRNRLMIILYIKLYIFLKEML